MHELARNLPSLVLKTGTSIKQDLENSTKFAASNAVPMEAAL